MADGFSRDLALRELASSDKDRLISCLNDLGARGEFAALQFDYAGDVVKHLSSKSPEVAAAAAGALGSMGGAGAKYADHLAACLDSEFSKVQLAAATAFGTLGSEVVEHGGQLKTLASKTTEEPVKLAAIQALGQMGAESQAGFVAGLLNEKSVDVQASALVALGGMGSAGVGKAKDIAKKLDSADTACAACSALSTLGGEVVTPHVAKIVTACLASPDMLTRMEALGALSKAEAGAATAKAKMASLLADKNPAVRAAAALCLSNLGPDAASEVSKVTALLTDEEEDLSWIPLQVGGGSTREPMTMRKPKCAALVALGAMKATKSVETITSLLNSQDWEIRFCAVGALGQIGDVDKETTEKVSMLLTDEAYRVRAKACEVIGKLKAESEIDKIVELFSDKAQLVRAEALKAIGMLGEAGAQYTTEMAMLLQDISNEVRSAAVLALAEMGEAGQVYASVVAKLLADPDFDVQGDACTALSKMGNYGAAFADEVGALAKGSLYEPLRAKATAALEGMGDEGLTYLAALGNEAAVESLKALKASGEGDEDEE